ncbi:MAG: PA2778 family cysteine peptidase [Magnetospirillum sp.]|nr:PA2778 family cysteine peptidase [Magnetospirillum sp.]
MRRIAALLCAGLVAGCAIDETGAGAKPAFVHVGGVPFHAQQGFGCGPASMAQVLGWSGADVQPTALDGQFYGAAGDPRPLLESIAQRYGRLATPVVGIDALLRELDAGHPVLVLQNLGVPREPLWNCVVAVGHNRSTGRVELNSGDRPGKFMSLSLLERLWSDADFWGLTVMRPGELPATASESQVVAAARALERTGHYWEAVVAYDSVLSQWPSSSDALFGLGGSLYLLGDAHGAADAYRAAAAVSNNPQPALEALAHVQAELSRADNTVRPPITKEISGVKGRKAKL